MYMWQQKKHNQSITWYEWK